MLNASRSNKDPYQFGRGLALRRELGIDPQHFLLLVFDLHHMSDVGCIDGVDDEVDDFIFLVVEDLAGNRLLPPDTTALVNAHSAVKHLGFHVVGDSPGLRNPADDGQYDGELDDELEVFHDALLNRGFQHNPCVRECVRWNDGVHFKLHHVGSYIGITAKAEDVSETKEHLLVELGHSHSVNHVLGLHCNSFHMHQNKSNFLDLHGCDDHRLRRAFCHTVRMALL